MAAVSVWETAISVHLLMGDVGISLFQRGQMGSACEERSGKGGYEVVSRL